MTMEDSEKQKFINELEKDKTVDSFESIGMCDPFKFELEGAQTYV